eukprot:scaffold9735_cov66-Cyclotella_meneghiniana.AAC.3
MKLIVIAQILLLPFLAAADCKVKCQKIRGESLNDLSSSVCKKIASQAHTGPFRSCIDGRKKGFDQCVSICLTGTHAADSYEGCKASKGNAARRNMMQWCRQGYDEILTTLKTKLSTKKPMVKEEPSVMDVNVDNLDSQESSVVQQSEAITEKSDSDLNMYESSEATQIDVVEVDEALDVAAFSDEASDDTSTDADDIGRHEEDESPSHGNLRSDDTIKTDDSFHLNDEIEQVKVPTETHLAQTTLLI